MKYLTGQKYSKKKRKTLVKIPVFTVKNTNWQLIIFIVATGNFNSCDGYLRSADANAGGSCVILNSNVDELFCLSLYQRNPLSLYPFISLSFYHIIVR